MGRRQGAQVFKRHDFVGYIIEQGNNDLEHGNRQDHCHGSDDEALDQELHQQLSLLSAHRLAHTDFATAPERLRSCEIRIVDAGDDKHKERQLLNYGDGRNPERIPDSQIGFLQRPFKKTCNRLLCVFRHEALIDAVQLRL